MKGWNAEKGLLRSRAISFMTPATNDSDSIFVVFLENLPDVY